MNNENEPPARASILGGRDGNPLYEFRWPNFNCLNLAPEINDLITPLIKAGVKFLESFTL